MLRKIIQTIVITLFFSASAAHAQSDAWVLSEKRGSVNILRSGVSQVAVSGGSLRAGDIISTGKKSRAVLIRGEEYVVVSPSSRLRIAKPSSDGGVIQFFKEVGSSLFRIDKKSTPHFGVDTPYLAAVVKGTTFSVTVTESGAAVQVTEGAVQVATRDGGATQLLSPGMIGMVESNQQFRLNVAGAQNQVIDSPNAPAGSIATPEPMSEDKLVEIASESFEGRIEAAVPAATVSLAKVTGGMVSGTLVSASVTPAALTDAASNGRSNASGRANNALPASALIASNQAVAANAQRGVDNSAVSGTVGNAVGGAVDGSAGSVVNGPAAGNLASSNGSANGNNGVGAGSSNSNGNASSGAVSTPPGNSGNSNGNNGVGAANGNAGGNDTGSGSSAANGGGSLANGPDIGSNGNVNATGAGGGASSGPESNGADITDSNGSNRNGRFVGFVNGQIEQFEDWRESPGSTGNRGFGNGGNNGGGGNGGDGDADDDDDDGDDD